MTKRSNNQISALGALEEFRHSNSLAGQTAKNSWSFKVRSISVKMPNSSWRKKAIETHDLHHVLLDIPCTMNGECQIAAWEFAAGPYRNVRAILFCLPLLAIGFCLAPMAIWESFKTGRDRRSLYDLHIDGSTSYDELVQHTKKRYSSRWRKALDVPVFVIWLIVSLSYLMLPIILISLVLY